MSPIINILAGPTAVGKTALAVEWAARHHAEIINADASLFYRGMDIGTAKPSRAERTRVPHHLIDILPVSRPYSIKEYARAAHALVHDIHARGQRVLVVGGSGFYLRSFYAPVIDGIEPGDPLRAEVAALEQAQGLTGLLERLDALNPHGTGQLHRENPRRVARALERCLASGQSLPELEQSFAAQPPPFPGARIRRALLLRPNAELHPRIEQRTRQMLADGLVDEVIGLRARGIEQNAPAARAIGYRETIAWLDDGARDRDKLAAAINLSTRRLIAKQRKWFRHQYMPDVILDGMATAEDLVVFLGDFD